jgi:hypothetical protein
LSGAAPTPVGGDGQLCGTQGQRVAVIAPVVTELVPDIQTAKSPIAEAIACVLVIVGKSPLVRPRADVVDPTDPGRHLLFL